MRSAIALIAAAVLAGCATVPDPAAEQQAALLASSVPTCKEAKECEVKWAAARDWVIDHAGMKLQNIQPDYMDTYNPPDSGTELAVMVRKKPQADGSYKIVARVWCDNWIGCIPMTPTDATLDFDRTVTAAYK